MNEHTPMKHGTLSLARRIVAPREVVYEAWTALEHRRHRFVGPSWTEIHRSVDLRVDGREIAHGRFANGKETIYTAPRHRVSLLRHGGGGESRRPAWSCEARHSSTARQPPDDLVVRLLRERPHLVAREGLDRVRYHDGLVALRAQGRGLGPRGLGELGGDDGGRGHPVVLEEHAVVHTARCAGPSVGEGLDDSVARLEDLCPQIL